MEGLTQLVQQNLTFTWIIVAAMVIFTIYVVSLVDEKITNSSKPTLKEKTLLKLCIVSAFVLGFPIAAFIVDAPWGVYTSITTILVTLIFIVVYGLYGVVLTFKEHSE